MIYIILPIYNEENSLYALITQLRKTMNGEDYKIIAVNDGSTDKSLDILSALRGNDFIVETYIINMNIGAVFLIGIVRALTESENNDDIIIIMESDQTSEAGFIKNLIFQIREKKQVIAIASRYAKGGGYVNFPLARRFFSYFANYLMHFYFPIPGVREYTIFFKAYRVDILRKAIKYFGRYGLIQSHGFVANAELLVKLSAFTNRISEVPFIYDYGKKRGKSKIQIFRTINEYFVVVLYLKRIFNKFKQRGLSVPIFE